MNAKQFSRANELMELIKITKNGLEDLKALKAQSESTPAHNSSYSKKIDGLYNFKIAEFDDGSGLGASLARYEGNDEILDAIITILTRQLAAFQKEVDNL